MKYYMFLLLGIIILPLFSQSSDINDYGKHEFKIDLAYLFVPCLKLEYEFLLSEENSIGAVCFFGNNDIDVAFQALGLYRFYFGNEPISGFFLEGHVGFSRLKNYDIESDEYDNSIGAGIALGNKYVSKKGIVLDIFAGVGKSVSYYSNSTYYPRLGITLGKRI